MAPEEHIRNVEYIIGHNFASKRYIHQALTAAGAENENYDGNRRLSQIGASLIDTILSLIVYHTDTNRESTARLRIKFANKEHYAIVARQTGIAECISYDDRKGSRSSVVLRRALNAIIAAVFLDTLNLKLTIGVILRVFMHENIKNDFLPAPATPTAASNPLSEGVDLLLGQWIDESCCIDRATDSNLQSGAPYHSLPVFASPFIGASQNVGGWAAAEPVLAGDDWPSLSAAELSFKMESLTGRFVEPIGPAEVTQPMAQQCMFLEANDELFQQGEIGYITPDPGFPLRNPIPNMNMPSSATDHCGLERPSKHSATPKKRKHTTNHSSLPPKCGFLQKYLSQERQRCLSLDMPPPEETYFNHDVQNTLHSLGVRHLETVLTLFATIANSHSIVALRDMIHNERTQRSPESHLLRSGISRRERLHLIQKLDQSATFMQLMRWLHIVELFQECGGPETQSYTGYIVNTPDNFRNQTKMPGNRRNWEDTRVTRSMMLEVFPDIKPADYMYRKLLPTFKKLRRLGKRLYTLASRFGKGIFGLMLDCTPNSGSMAILDNMISELDDSAFNTFVNLLESSQANILRKFGAAILPLLDSITCFTVHPAQACKLENTDPQDIVSKAKGSDALLHLISS